MPMQITPTRAPNGQALVVVQVAPEAADAIDILRKFKKEFPAEWRQVNYEIMPAKPADVPAIVGENGEPINRINGHFKAG
jgi:hypothetical protein